MSSSIFSSLILTALVLAGLIIAGLLVKLANKNGKFKTDYDERQKIMIGKSYKCAMITTWVLMAVYMIIDMGGNKLPMENSLVIFTIMFISIIVYASYAVWTDAYFGINNNLKIYAIIAVVATAVNAFMAVTIYKSGQMIVDGVLTSKFISAECATMFLVLGVQFFVKYIVDKKRADSEEEEE